MVKEYLWCSDPLRLTQYCRERFEVELIPSDATKLATELRMLHRSWRNDYSSAHCICWMLTRLNSLGYFTIPHVDPDYIRLTVALHFWAWEGPDWSEYEDLADCSDWSPEVRRSPLSRLHDMEPLNRVARRIVGGVARSCPYCSRYFRNPDAMVLHISESHPDACCDELLQDQACTN